MRGVPLQRLFARPERNRCVYCWNPATAWDHVEPLSRGGAHDEDNLVRACRACNSIKSDQPLVVFLARVAAWRAMTGTRPPIAGEPFPCQRCSRPVYLPARGGVVRNVRQKGERRRPHVCPAV